jgi:hypothetical protein
MRDGVIKAYLPRANRRVLREVAAATPGSRGKPRVRLTHSTIQR